MDTLELNKYAGGVLGTLLVIIVISHIGDFLVHSEMPEQRAVSIAVPDAAEKPAAADAPAEAAGGESAIALLASADAEAGKKVAKKCAACHSFEQGGPNKVGPNLWNIIGAPKAQVAGYSYYSAMQGVGGEWSYEALDAFLTKPKDAVKGTKMAFAGVKKPNQRANLIAFLRGLSDSPKPLP